MPPAVPAPSSPPDLPAGLAYLAGAIGRAGTELAAGTDAEDIDPRPLERALKKRLAGVGDPSAAVAGDLAALETWLRSFDSDDHPGWWAAGALRGLALYGFDPDALGEDPDPGPQPSVFVDAPVGWTAEDAICTRVLTKGKRGAVQALFIASQPGFGDLLRTQWRAGGLTAEPVEFGLVSGERLISELPGPVSHKRVQYELDAPGGSVYVNIARTTGKPFDEAEVEAVLHTLRIIPPREA
ncbi:hypothetical protein [Alienimonas chondri]|uniref:Uncharacterized protein n=1 Tax=Alienimonas chondri TaxID=2681879 RepID=A0ABX1VHQ0_9PLAN|nr:hypothetical protein [Alienimonas chondri]NNJ27629.1 hypothetical protein [Alienimonas chondri]